MSLIGISLLIKYTIPQQMKVQKSVFVVDGNPETLESISLILKDLCTLYLFQAVNSQFFELLRKSPPDIVLIDFITPLSNAPETIDYIRGTYGKKIKIYLMSGTKLRYIPTLDVDGFLKKPFLIQDIRELVNDTMNS